MLTKQEVSIFGSAAMRTAKIIEPLGKYLIIISSTISVLMALLIILDILGRQLFNSPISGLIEIETFLLAILFFFSLAFTTLKKGHVSVDLLKSKFSLHFKMRLGTVLSILGIFLFAIISWQNVVHAVEAFEAGEASDVRMIPLYPFYLLTAFGSGLTAIVLTKDLLEYIDDVVKTASRPWGSTLFLFVIASLVLLSPPLMKMVQSSLNPTMIAVILLTSMLGLMLLGFPVAFTMGLIGFLGTWYLTNAEVSLGILRMSVYKSVSNYFFCVLPFFILMGFLCLKAGVSGHVYRAGQKWFGQLPGGLAIGTVFGCGGFSAICGDSMATAATMGSVSLPEMKKYQYDDSLATGSVAAGGTLGILIPPSLGFIIYAIITEESVGKLFMAGLLPGIFLMLMFSLSIYLRCRLNPALGPKAPKVSLVEKLQSLKGVWPVTLLFGFVIGGIYMGYFTPTEAGGVGVIGALIIAIISKEFTWSGFWEALFTSMQMTAMILTILVGVTILGYFVVLTDIPMKLASVITTLNVSRYVIYVLILVLYLVLGMMMNIVPMMMLTLPILFPTVVALGFDPIWFGVIMVIMMEMGQISPPVGINVFVISGIAGDVAMSRIFKGVLPFILVEVVVIIILTIFPQIAMVLPNAMKVLPSIGG